MYLVRSPAIATLRAQLDQAGRELVTVLAGLEMLASSRGPSAEGRGPLPWTDDVTREQAVRHARRFAHDAALARVVDALDAWLARLRQVRAFCDAVPPLGTQERGVKARLEALAEGLDADCTPELALAHLAIQWRNRRLHSGAANRLEQRYVATLRGDADLLASRHGLAPDALLAHFDASRSPRLRELTALSRATREACTQLDHALVAATSAEGYAQEALAGWFRDAERADDAGERLAAVWATPPEKRRGRLEHLLRTLGYRDRPVREEQAALSEDWLASLAAAGHREAAARFGLVEERTGERE